MKILIGRSNPKLGNKIAEHFSDKTVNTTMSNFADGEIRIQINDNVRGKDLFIFQSLQPPADNLFELLLLIDAARRASCRRITVVAPYFGYARQERKEKPRVPIAAKMVSVMLEKAGADRILTMDLHAPQIQGFFEIPHDHLISDSIFDSFAREYSQNEELVIVSPDVGGVKRIEKVAEVLNASLAIIHKKRNEPNQSEALAIIGDVRGKTAIIRDDIIDTGGTLAKAAALLKSRGATKVFAFCTHPIFSGNAIENISNSEIDLLGVTDTVPLNINTEKSLKGAGKLRIVSVANLFYKAIYSIHNEQSVSTLFGKKNYLNF